MSTNYTESDFIQFGAGYVYGLAVGGQESSIVIPGYFATIESASVDIAVTIKELRGAFEDAEDLASASRKITVPCRYSLTISSWEKFREADNSFIAARPSSYSWAGLKTVLALFPRFRQFAGNRRLQG